MLVLSRRLGESVFLKFKTTGTDGKEVEKEVVVKVIEVGSRKVRLGFDTDKDVTILRDELVKGKKQQPPVPKVVGETAQA